eukprot:6804063-Pyramimonas_sp.AAC.1
MHKSLHITASLPHSGSLNRLHVGGVCPSSISAEDSPARPRLQDYLQEVSVQTLGLVFEALMVILDKIVLYKQHKPSTGDTDTLIKDQLAVAKTLIQWLSRLCGAAALRDCACEVLKQPDLMRVGGGPRGSKGDAEAPPPPPPSPNPVVWKDDPAVTLESMRTAKRAQRKPAAAMTGMAPSAVIGVEPTADVLDTVLITLALTQTLISICTDQSRAHRLYLVDT